MVPRRQFIEQLDCPRCGKIHQGVEAVEAVGPREELLFNELLEGPFRFQCICPITHQAVVVWLDNFHKPTDPENWLRYILLQLAMGSRRKEFWELMDELSGYRLSEAAPSKEFTEKSPEELMSPTPKIDVDLELLRMKEACRPMMKSFGTPVEQDRVTRLEGMVARLAEKVDGLTSAISAAGHSHSLTGGKQT